MLAKKKLDKLVLNIVDTYQSRNGLSHIQGLSLPDRTAVHKILFDLFRILLPGYMGHDEISKQSISFYVGDLLSSVYSQLSSEIEKALKCQRAKKEHSVCRAEAEKIVLSFFQTLPEIRERLKKDVQAAYDGDPAAKSLDEVILSYPCLYAIATYRLAHELYLQGERLIARMMTEEAHGKTGIDIHPGAKIGDYFFIDHGTGVVIGETCLIGNQVKIYQGVTLGALSFPKDKRGKIIRGQKRHPTIKDNVTIYAGATILGPTEIGKNCVIGGNVWLTESVDDDMVVTISKPELLFKSKRK